LTEKQLLSASFGQPHVLHFNSEIASWVVPTHLELELSLRIAITLSTLAWHW
jgi:hypothetical protein